MSADGGKDANANETAAQLAAIRLQRQALAEAREARQQPTEAELLAIEQRELAAEQALEKFEQEYGRVGRAIEIVRSDVGSVIVKRPHMATYRKFQDDARDTTSAEKLVRPCVLYPSKPEFDRMVEELPFLLVRCADAVCTLAGVRKEDVRAKQ